LRDCRRGNRGACDAETGGLQELTTFHMAVSPPGGAVRGPRSP
jgi:hypothetical protein